MKLHCNTPHACQASWPCTSPSVRQNPLCLQVNRVWTCSVYPTACFKKYSSKERAKLNQGVEELDRRKDELSGRRRRRSRPRSTSPPRPTTYQHRRRHSATTPSQYRSPSTRYTRELRRTQQEIDMERSPRPYRRQAETNRRGKSSWEEVLQPAPA